MQGGERVPIDAQQVDAPLSRFAVFLVMTVGADSKAHRNEVEVGTVTPEAAEIRKGIKPGDKVIVRGQNGLPDGAAVTVGS